MYSMASGSARVGAALASTHELIAVLPGAVHITELMVHALPDSESPENILTEFVVVPATNVAVM